MTKGHRFGKGNKFSKGRPKGSGNVEVAREWVVKYGWKKLFAWANGNPYVSGVDIEKDRKTGQLKKINRYSIPQESTQADALKLIFAYGIGKPTEKHEHSGPEGEPINVVVKKYA